MIVTHRSRRQFLLGTGGFTLALPFLPSLLPRAAQAQASQGAPRPRFIALATPHGGAWAKNMFPSDKLLSERTPIYSDHEARRGQLRLERMDNSAFLSPVLSARSSLLTDRIASKLNVLRGLDVPFYLGHHTGGHLGNFARAEEEHSKADWLSRFDGYRVTIDQVMAFSQSFYGKGENPPLKSMHVGTDGGHTISWGYRRVSDKTGTQPTPSVRGPRELFDRIFANQQPSATPAPAPEQKKRVPLIQRVRESYKHTRDGAFSEGRRLSSEDKLRLDEHIERLDEIDQRLNSKPLESCNTAMPPKKIGLEGFGENNNNVPATTEYYQLTNDVIATAIKCGASRIATVYSAELWSDYAGDWHADIAHGSSDDEDRQRTLIQAYQRFFEQCFLDLVTKLDVEEPGTDGTYLDNTLVQWTQESGSSTHNALSLPVVTAGSARGYFTTGHYVDYRNQKKQKFINHDGAPDWEGLYPGLLYSRWLATALQAMGVQPDEFEHKGERGYGSAYTNGDYGEHITYWPQQLFRDASVPMPLITTKA